MSNLRSNSIGTQEWLHVTKGMEITSLDYSYTPTVAATTTASPIQIYVSYPMDDGSQMLPLEYSPLSKKSE